MKNRLRKALAQAAMLAYLLIAAPVFAMSEIEQREMHRPAIVQTISIRQRHRALDRRYGMEPVRYRFVY